MTLLDHLVTTFRQTARYNRHDLNPPHVLLWPDGERLWEKAIPLLSEALPERLALGEPDASLHRGPSTWSRYQLARHTAPKTPVVYLPGTPRHAFRSATGFPEAARHGFALPYQGLKVLGCEVQGTPGGVPRRLQSVTRRLGTASAGPLHHPNSSLLSARCGGEWLVRAEAVASHATSIL